MKRPRKIIGYHPQAGNPVGPDGRLLLQYVYEDMWKNRTPEPPATEPEKEPETATVRRRPFRSGLLL